MNIEPMWILETYLDAIDYLQEHTCSVYILSEDVHICILGMLELEPRSFHILSH